MKLTVFVTACMIAVTANQWWTAEASPPVVGGPGRCVSPNDKVNRCNVNEDLSDERVNALKVEILAHKQRTIDLVAAGELDTYMEMLTEDIKYYYNDQCYSGRDEVKAFILTVVGSGKPLVISNVQARVLSETHVTIVDGEWDLEGYGHGRYLHEDYYKQDDGKWMCPTMSLKSL